MSKWFNINEGLVIHIIEDGKDPLLTPNFYKELYKNVFSDQDNNLKAGIIGISDPQSLKRKIEDEWFISCNSEMMFFLFKNKNVIGTTQAFRTNIFDNNTLSLGYIVSPSEQGKGYGTVMLKFVASYLTDLKKTVVLGFRDGNLASERIATKSNFTYLMRTNVHDAFGQNRPMTYYKFAGNLPINEQYNVLTDKVLTTNQWIMDDNGRVLSRVNPKKMNLEEYVYFSNSQNKPAGLNESYFIFSSPHFKLRDQFRMSKLNFKNFAITDYTAKKLFDPKTKGDIILDKMCGLIESNLQLLQINESKTAMLLGNNLGEVKITVVGDTLFLEDFIIS